MTHGLCGKEGAMVFKRVLKGIGRLMLTTAVMCGVGLFLCSSEVKAASDPALSFAYEENVTDKDAGRFTLTIDNAGVQSEIKVTKIDFCKTENGGALSNVISSVTIESNNIIAADGNKVISITNKQFIEGYTDSLTGKVDIKGIKVTYTGGTLGSKDAVGTATSAPIYKVSVENANPTGVSFQPDFSYKVGNRNMQYGYAGESYTVTPKKDNYDLNYYYDYVKKSTAFPAILDMKDGTWRAANTITGELKSSQDENELKVAYLPRIKELKISDPTNGRLDITTLGTAPITRPVKYEIENFAGEESFSGLDKYNFVASVPSYTTPGMIEATTVGQTQGECAVTMSLGNADTSVSGIVRISAMLGNNIEVAHADLPVSLSIKATGFELNSTTVSLMAGVEQQFDIIKAITPAGADQTISNYTFQVTESPNSTLLESISYAAGKVTLKAKSNVTSGTATVKINLMDGSNVLASQTLNVKIISFDKEKTISSINKNNKNYITYNKDKGYSLDIEQLIIDNAKDTSDNAVTITKDQITEVYVGGSSCSDGIWKPSEAALNKKVTCKINGTAISSDSFTVSAYPMPTATYSSSNRTLSVKIPTKVATAYSDDNNIRQSKGFKLILEDSSGNTLYEYTDSKYQNVLSSSSESTVTYTVPAADIEGMITSAASNGKFSADTTSVKFKVIPMGYKQSSTSDETIKAKDEIAGKTDAVTVYKVSASGTNFTSSAAYGLDGQTVSITATPNSGYSFKQWSDGNTSNPRQVKVSASGTRSFQAVAGDRVANSTGAGGTDNSELYDDVPKTAESNSAIWLIVFMVFAVMGTTYALYLQLRAANSKHDR